mmetsp:Transcript_6013/g.8951  ORF Transcript_6013/g.8951 Transcript_6013/m.8951 type:complete len:208 (-) Transcript_6013:302-925(-)
MQQARPMTCTSPEGKPYKERPAPRHTPCDCRQRRSCHSNPGRTCTSAWWHCIQTFRGRSGGSRNRSEAQSSAAVATRTLACSTSPRTHLRTLVRSGKILYTGPGLQNRRLLTHRTSSCTQNAPLLYTSTLDLAQALGTLASGRLTSESMAHGRRTDRPAHTNTIPPRLHPGPSRQTASPAAVHPPCTFRGGPRSQQWTTRQRTNQLI